jgi:hypothetical protein
MFVDKNKISVESGLLSVDGGWQALSVESCLLMYSRGYKNRFIVKKMFKILLIFKVSLECQLFIFMTL